MRITRLLGVAFIILAPTAVFALKVPFVGSPFEHMTVFFSGDVSSEGQTATVANATNLGVNDICYNEVVDESSGAPAETYNNNNPNFKTCEQQKVTKANCPQKKGLVGSVTYQTGFEGDSVINRCDKQPASSGASKCIAIGDSNAVGMVGAGCNNNGQQTSDVTCNSNTVDPTHPACSGRTPSTVANEINQLNSDQLQNSKVVLSPGCTNDPSQCLSACSDPTSPGCPINQQIQTLKNDGVPANNIYCMGSGGSSASALDSITSQACGAQGAQYLGALPVNNQGDWHATSAGYQQMMDEVGQIASPDAPASDSNDSAGLSSAPLTQQGANDQIRSIAASACPTGADCTQFGNNMVSTFGSECSGVPNCARDGSQVQGSFQQIPSNYTQGIQTYLNSCDQSTDACQTVTSTCVNGASDRMTNICSAAAAVGNSQSVEASIQSAFPNDPQQQAAAHMLYQIAPGQFAANTDSLGNYTLSSASISTLCTGSVGQVCLSQGATSGDAINALANTKGVQQGITLAASGSGGVTSIPPPAIEQTLFAQTPPTQTPAAPAPNVVVINNSAANPSISSGGLGGFGGLGSMYGLGIGSSLGNLFGNLFKPSTTQTTQTAAAPNPPTATLSVQPQSVSPGQSVGVSWTSSNATACNITDNGSLLGQGVSGSASIPTASTTPSSITVQLVCSETGSSQLAQQNATVSVTSASI